MVSAEIKREIESEMALIEYYLNRVLKKRNKLDSIKSHLKAKTLRELANDPFIKEMNTRIESLTDQLGI